MSVDWYPGIREASAHWSDAEMLQQTLESLEQSFKEGKDAVIDSAKSIVEVVCRIIVDELDSVARPAKPQSATPHFGEWVGAAVKVLRLGENQNAKFLKLVSQHHKLTTALGDLRNDAGPTCHGRDGYLDRLSMHHRRSAVLSADALVGFLFHAYQEAELDLIKTREPYERFPRQHELVDLHTAVTADVDEDGVLDVTVRLATGDEVALRVEVSRLLYQLARDAYREALNAARQAPSAEPENDEEAA